MNDGWKRFTLAFFLCVSIYTFMFLGLKDLGFSTIGSVEFMSLICVISFISFASGERMLEEILFILALPILLVLGLFIIIFDALCGIW